MRRSLALLSVAALGASGLALSTSGPASAAPPDNSGATRAAEVASLWTAERRAAAQPRDLLLDDRGLAYLRRADGSLQPYGHSTPAQAGPQITAVQSEQSKPTAQGKPGGGGTSDTTGPTIANLVPTSGATIGATQTFSASVTDTSGVRSVTVVVANSSGASSSFAASNTSGSTWAVSLQGFTDGLWSWYVVATDRTSRGGYTTTSPTQSFTVATGGTTTPPPSGDVVKNSAWTDGGKVQTAAGRIYFFMPDNRRQTRWSGFVCSGTVVTDTATLRSVILTAAHCVYDDANKAFAKDVMFIPNQVASGTRTDRNCANDVMGCWVPTYGVVDVEWTTRTFPDNIAWDYAYYVVPTTGAHSVGTTPTSDSLEDAASSLPVSFEEPKTDLAGDNTDRTHALGYSYSDDPKFMYCAEDMTLTGTVNWWLPNCGLSGGASGGPWMQPVTSGDGPVISVNSWGYTNQPGMAGPKLSGTSAEALFTTAQTGSEPATADRGVIVTAVASA